MKGARRPRPVGRWLCALAAGAGLWFADSDSRADPSVWARARKPALHDTHNALREIDRLLVQARLERRRGPLGGPARTLLLRDAKARLDQLAAARSPDPYLRERLGGVLYGLFEAEGDPRHLREAAEAFAFVASAEVPVTTRAEAYNELAICLARLGKHQEEIDAYGQAIDLDPHAESRAILLANQAEGFMLLGNISAAVAGYRASLAVTPPYALHHVAVTTWWGMGVALDRSGDFERALDQLRRARSYDPNDRRLASDTWFYLPSYDEHWYAALGHWLTARDSKIDAERLAAYRLAIDSWRKWLSQAPPTDHWARLAGVRLSQCEREYQRALARAKD